MQVTNSGGDSSQQWGRDAGVGREPNARYTSKQGTTIGTWCSVPPGTPGRWGRTFARADPPEAKRLAELHHLLFLID